MPAPASVEALAARLAVEDAVTRMFVATDERNWSVVQDCFTDPFMLDMGGGSPAGATPQQVTRDWSEAFKSLDHVHHQIGNMRTEVDGDQALVTCYGVAFHHRGKVAGVKTRVFVGSYELALQAQAGTWRIARLTFRLKFVDGNLELDKAPYVRTDHR